jgi:hypothetical protein
MPVSVDKKEEKRSWHTGGSAVKRADDMRHQDAYWDATQDVLKTIQRRGDAVIFAAAAILLGVLAYNHEHSGELFWWLVAGTGLLAVIVQVLWFVTTRRRRIAAARGLVCSLCEYVPHDTEITEVAATRRCPRCDESLQR